jgi:hypothetical protein
MKLTSKELAEGQIIREPVGRENGYWAGAPGVFYAGDEKAWYLTYRIRRPRGVEPDRGGEARIARSTDLKNFQDIWSVTKDKFNSPSIERCALRKGMDGIWRYFISYVDADNRWCISVLKARELSTLNPVEAQPVLKAHELGLEGVKDPWIYEERSRFYMFVSVATATKQTTKKSHSTADIFNTGECVSATGLATSSDLENWEWQGVIFLPDENGWDKYCRRINSVVSHEGRYYAFYDGSTGQHENYEERTGLAGSADLKGWATMTADAPLFTSPHATGSLRYMDAQIIDGKANLFYEFSRADGGHDLRLLQTHISNLPLKAAGLAE